MFECFNYYINLFLQKDMFSCIPYAMSCGPGIEKQLICSRISISVALKFDVYCQRAYCQFDSIWWKKVGCWFYRHCHQSLCSVGSICRKLVRCWFYDWYHCSTTTVQNFIVTSQTCLAKVIASKLQFWNALLYCLNNSISLKPWAILVIPLSHDEM